MTLPPELQPTPIADKKLLMLQRAISTLEAADVKTVTAFAALLLTKNGTTQHFEIVAMCSPAAACIFALEFVSKTINELLSKSQLSSNDTTTLDACRVANAVLSAAVANYLEESEE